MGDVASERRSALRVPVHGVAVCYGGNLPVLGTIENLSTTGALIDLDGVPDGATLELELKLGHTSGRVTARSVRVEHTAARARVALRFDHVDEYLRGAIEAAIDHAVIAAGRRPVLVIDDNQGRRATLFALLASQGMAPVSARTPLDAIAVLTSPQLAVSVALLAPSFGHSIAALRHLVSDSFPWVRAAEISDDPYATLDRAQQAWSGTDIARLARAIA